MDTRKFEYLETIRESIELGELEELRDYVGRIRHKVRNDTDFEDIFLEISSGKYERVISLIDDLIYKEMQEEFEGFAGDGDEDEEQVLSDEDVSKFGLEMDFEDEQEEEITFESFDEDSFSEKGEDDNF